MSRRHHEESSSGEESFLDTIANLIGILIIMIVVVAVRTKYGAESYARSMADEKRAKNLSEPLQQARNVEDSLIDQMIAIEEYDLETQYRKLERDKLLEKVQFVREATKDRLNQLDAEQRKRVEQDQTIDKLKDDLEKLKQLSGSKDESPRPEIVLEHLPTPMAQTVFQKEMHVMLKGGRVTVIPWDRLVDVLKQQIPLAAQRQASRGRLEDTIGPVNGFLLKYRMVAVPAGFELDRFEIDPTESVIAEPIDEALKDSSRFLVELSGRHPRETVVAVWVYPDSFEDFRALKSRLYSAGFLCAARPLPEGIRIGASPHGSKSSAQ